MRKNIPFLLSLILLGNIYHLKAQFNPETQSYLDKAVAKLQGNSGIELAYDMNGGSTSEGLLLSEGKLWLKGDLYRLETEDMVVINDGKNQWVYRSDDQELMIQTVDTTQMDDTNPLAVVKNYHNGYQFDVQKETDSTIVVNMVSQDQFNPYLIVGLELNKHKNEIVSIKMLLRDETNIVIKLDYVNQDLKLKDTFFDFSRLNREVSDTIDLRY